MSHKSKYQIEDPIKPTKEEVEKATGKDKTRQAPKIEWNDRAHKSASKLYSITQDGNIDPDTFNGSGFPRKNIRDFIARCDLKQAPLRQEIFTMTRVKAPEYDDDGEQIGNKKKEWIFYEIHYYGTDWLGRKLHASTIEGKYQQQTKTVVTKWNPEREDYDASYELGQPVTRYYIPFSKKAVDDILKRTDNEDRKSEILRYVRFNITPQGASSDRDNRYTCNQFVNSEFEHMEYLHKRLGGPPGDNYVGIGRMDPSVVHTSCTCPKCKSAERTKSTNIQ